MIVNSDNLAEVIVALDREQEWVIDTETTGLRPYHGDKPFSVIIGAGGTCYYFNFIDYDGETVPILNPAVLKEVLGKPRRYIFHNVKFDLSMLANVGLYVPAEADLYCTMAADRIICDNRLHRGDFSLSEMGYRYGAEKSSAVEDYILDHKLYKDIPGLGKSDKVRLKFFNLVPFSIIVPYGVDDVKTTLAIYRGHQAALATQRTVEGQPDKKKLLDNEMKLLRVVWDMEQRGVQLDLEYVKRALVHYQTLTATNLKLFFELTGLHFEPKPTLYKKVFAAEKWVYTDKGNPSFSGDVLDTFVGPVAQVVNRLRECKHQIDTYERLMHHVDADGIIHTDFHQHIPTTGRFSSSKPNLQNMERPDEEAEFTPRKAIVPRPGYFFAMIDYDQMEYRMMLDYAGAHSLIEEVNNGLDVHTAMAEKIGVDRDTMKTGNFAILYGSGDEALGKTLGGGKDRAKRLRRAIHDNAPEVGRWIDQVHSAVRRRGYVFNWLGRVFNFKSDEEYKSPNAMIQGGCADVNKVAMVDVHEYLKQHNAYLVLSIHDELVVEFASACEYVVPKICNIMESVYSPFSGLPLTVSVEWSGKNLAEKRKDPFGTKTRDSIQRQGAESAVTVASGHLSYTAKNDMRGS